MLVRKNKSPHPWGIEPQDFQVSCSHTLPLSYREQLLGSNLIRDLPGCERAHPFSVAWVQFTVQFTWRLSFWLVLVHALFHLVVQFSSPYENQHSNFKFDLETMDKKSHLVESPPLNSSSNYHYYFAFDNDSPSNMRGAHIWIRSYFSYQANLVTDWRVSTMIAVWTLRMVMSNVDALNILALTAEKSFVAPTAKPTWICA